MLGIQPRSNCSAADPVPPGASGHFRWLVLGVLFCATTVNYMDRFLLGVLKPTIIQDLRWSETDYANVVFCFQLAYAIGVAEPVSVMADTFGTETVSEQKITTLIREYFSLTPKGIIEALDLRRPIYKDTAAYGHFGRSGPGFTWERTDRADALRKAAGLGAPAAVEAGAHR